MNKLIKIYNILYKEFGPQKWWLAKTKNKQFEIIIGAILTQNTSWKNVEKALINLEKENLISKSLISPATCCLVNPDGEQTVEKAFNVVREVSRRLCEKYHLF